MKKDLSLRVHIFVIAVLVILLGQSVYSWFNLRSFQSSYIHALQDKSSRVGNFLRDDIQHVLKMGIPLDTVSGLEQSLARTLHDIPEASFIEVVNADGNLLYRADSEGAEKIPPKRQKGSFTTKPYAQQLKRMGLTPEDTDITIPLQPVEQVAGYIHIQISGNLIYTRSRQILWDMLTVMLTSLLLSFEFLTFFVVYYIQHPLDVLRRDIAFRFSTCKPVNPDKYRFLGNIGMLAHYYNAILHNYLGAFTIGSSELANFAGKRKNLQLAVERQNAKIQEVDRKIKACPASGLFSRDPESAAPRRLGSLLGKMHKQMQRLAQTACMTDGPAKTSSIVNESDVAAQTIPSSLIRPLIFLFIMADGFSLSFFPMFVDSMYEPVWGLSREMVMSLPMSAFMLILAISMPLAGSLSDSRGWHRPLILGLVVNTAGHLLTALSQDITQLIAFRSMTAAGFGIVFICAQRFVIDNTSARSRAMGMSGFLAAFFSGDICGTVIGAMLAERIGYGPVFYVSAFFSGLALFFLLAVFRGSFRPPRAEPAGNIGIAFSGYQLIQVFRDKEFFSTVWLQAVPAKLALVGFLFFFVPLYLNSIDAIQSNIGRVIMCYSICIVFIGPLVSWILPQEHLRKYLVGAGGLITAGAMLSFTFASGFGPLLVIVILLGVAQSISVPSQAAIISETSAVKEIGAGAGMGIYRFWERTGNVAGPLLMAILIAWMGYEKSVVALGGGILACSLLYLAIVAYSARNPN